MSGEALERRGDAAVPGVAAPAAGWFGKLPMLGDFASRRLPPAFIGACDEWLSQSLRSSQAQLGARWLDTYLTAPVWRFAWAPGVIDAQWWFGVLMPSVDAVGRYFPLVIAAEHSTAPACAAALDRLGEWYGHIGAAALATLHEGASVQALEAALADAPAWAEAAGSGSTLPDLLAVAGGRQRGTAAGEPSVRRWAAALALHASLHRYAGHSLWWPLHDGHGEDSLSVKSGLPAPGEFALMLDGNW